MTTRMSPTRKVALAGGVAYLVTFAASIPQLGLFADLVADPVGFLEAGDATPAASARCPSPCGSSASACT
jgi:hypothetical protein